MSTLIQKSYRQSVEDWGCGQLFILSAFSCLWDIYLPYEFCFFFFFFFFYFFFFFFFFFFFTLYQFFMFLLYVFFLPFMRLFTLSNFFYQHFWYLVVLCQQSLYLFRGHTCVLHMVSMIDNLKTGYFCSLISDRLFVILSTL
jgi:hypothetical protein